MPIRLLAVTSTLLTALALAPAQPPAQPSPIPPRTVTLNQPSGTLGQAAAELSKQTGFPVTVNPALTSAKCPVQFKAAPFWTALEGVAKTTDSRIVLHDAGRKIGLEPRGTTRESSSVYGPIRTVSLPVSAPAGAWSVTVTDVSPACQAIVRVPPSRSG